MFNWKARISGLSFCELAALDRTVLHCLRGTYSISWDHGPHTSARAVYLSLRWDFEDGIEQLPKYSRARLLQSLGWELTTGRNSAVYRCVVLSAIVRSEDMTMAECGANNAETAN